MADIEHIVLVGHCASDSFALKLAIGRAVPDLPVLSAASSGDLDKLDLPRCLLLINRVLPPGYAASMGVELIRQLNAQPGQQPAMMLISDYPDAQAAAEQAGAWPGFGKSELGGDKPAERLRAAVGG